MHNLLKRQLKKYFGESFQIPTEWQQFVEAVNDAYIQSDIDRGMIERSLDLSSQELLHANSEMQALISLLNATIESTADGILVVNRQGKIVSFNQKFIEMWRIPRQIVESRDDDQALSFVLDQFRDPEEFLKKVREVNADTETESYDELKFKDGRIFERYSKPQRIGEIVMGRVWSFRDVTEHRRAEEEKDKLRAQLLQAQKMQAIGQLTGGIAHDFNNILTAIISYGNLLITKMGESDPLRTYVDSMLSSSERAANLVTGLLAFSRKQIMNPKPVDMNQIIKRVETLLRRLIGEDIELKTLLIDKELIVMADTNQIEQVLMNLATNARDAMPNGGTITLGTELAEIDDEFIKVHGYGEVGKYALITFSDTGAGMDEQTKEKIFEPFFTTKDVNKGTGLGLAMAYGIIKQHNGYINVYSELGEGTTFRIYLQFVKYKREEKEPETISVARGGTETILVAEDNAEVRAVTNEILTGAGYKILEAVDGEDAIHKFMENKDEINLLILDAIMPKKNGKEAYEAISQAKPDVKVIFTSGYTADIIYSKGVVKKGFDFLLKPFPLYVLLKKVRNALDKEE